MYKIIISAALVVFMVSMFSCKKDDSGPSAPTNTELLTKSSWKLVNLEADTLGTGVYFSLLPYMDNCEKDDITTYKTDNTFQVTEGASVCTPGDPNIYNSGTWQFSADEKILIQQGTAFDNTFNIVSLTDASLVVTEKSLGVGFKYTFGH